jgi:hypothetical protein
LSEGRVPDFDSPEEFAALMAGITQRLHAKNRIAMGESSFVWHLAKLIEGAGQELGAGLGDRDTQASFGDGYSPGRLTHEEQVDALLARLRARMVPR